MRAGLVAALGLASGCARPAAPEPFLPFAFEARVAEGEVRVVPALQLHPPVGLDLESFFGAALPERQLRARRQRTHQLGQLADAVGWALPGEVNGELGARWDGEFLTHPSWPAGSRQRLGEALRSRRGVDDALADLAHGVGGDAVLVSWMDRLDATPLTLRDIPGTVLDTPSGPVVVDGDEPYLVSAEVGMALVTRDGEVVLRYADTYETVLSAQRGPWTAGRDLAHALAAEVAKVWATDPRLSDAPRPRRFGS
ncbi:MAG: hypothetical protein R3F59_30420 [Myxococcota bacterium]